MEDHREEHGGVNPPCWLADEKPGDSIHELHSTFPSKSPPSILPRPNVLCVQLSVTPWRREKAEDRVDSPCDKVGVLLMNSQTADNKVVATIQP